MTRATTMLMAFEPIVSLHEQPNHKAGNIQNEVGEPIASMRNNTHSGVNLWRASCSVQTDLTATVVRVDGHEASPKARGFVWRIFRDASTEYLNTSMGELRLRVRIAQ